VAFDPIEVTPLQLISGSRTIQGWATGSPVDEEDTLRFSELQGVHPMIETYPLEQPERPTRACLAATQNSAPFSRCEAGPSWMIAREQE
jgi:D-arabinose 1-dehydrogenase-like Zn-dependent alcohol dehydrogenase